MASINKVSLEGHFLKTTHPDKLGVEQFDIAKPLKKSPDDLRVARCYAGEP